MPRTTIIIQTEREPSRQEVTAMLHGALNGAEGLVDPEAETSQQLRPVWGIAVMPTSDRGTDVVEMTPNGALRSERAKLKPRPK